MEKENKDPQPQPYPEVDYSDKTKIDPVISEVRIDIVRSLLALLIIFILTTAIVYLYGPYLERLQKQADQRASQTPTPTVAQVPTATPTTAISLTPTPLPTEVAEELSEFYEEPNIDTSSEGTSLSNIGNSFPEAEAIDLDAPPDLDLDI